MNENTENFAELLESSFKTLNTGEIVEGTVTAVTPGEIHLDLGAKTTGVIAREKATDDPQAKLDVGGIAKGYIADSLMNGFRESGISSAYVNLGGNVAVLGPKEDGSPWRIGVRSPQQGSDDVVATIESTGGSLVTSGLYERQFERDGTRYWHILDPRTGYPVESDIVSASVYAQQSIDGDGLTKPLFMLGADAALEFLGQYGGVEGLLIDGDGGQRKTPGSGFVPRETA
jgi:thiamine biosynthesis lipoprotein